jgi:hypothetical protein
MKSRLFAFGCSFTNYEWPTWADILGVDYDVFENWGRTGAGNHFILYSIIEAVARNNISEADTVAVMFTNVAREDRFVDGKWLTPGNVYNQLDLSKELPDPTGYFLTNLSVIDAVRRVLDQVGCDYHLMSMVPFDVTDYHSIFNLTKNIETTTIKLYQDTLSKIKPSVYEVVYNQNWESRGNISIPRSKRDAFKVPATAVLQARYQENIGADWPSFDDFINNNVSDVSTEILNELEEQYQFISWRDRILNQRRDFHPTPLEHFEYLDKIGFRLSNKQRQYAEYWNNRVLTLEDTGFKSKKVNRF